MTIEINDTKTVHDIQQEFATKFPFLKLEFFKEAHDRDEASNGTPCRPDQIIGEIRKNHVMGIISINPQSTTGAVEQEFKKRFNLYVQIYRVQMDQWIQTVGTDFLTLNEQSDLARNSTIFYNSDHQYYPDES